MNVKGYAAAAALLLAGCATASGTDGWTGGDPKTFAADEAACRDSSASGDMRQADAYSNPQYGVVAALAGALDNSSVRGGSFGKAREAVFNACMAKAGWRKGG